MSMKINAVYSESFCGLGASRTATSVYVPEGAERACRIYGETSGTRGNRENHDAESPLELSISGEPVFRKGILVDASV